MLSVCMIVRNEAKELPSLLENISAVADEIIVVDTGSTDRTRKILKKHPLVQLHYFAWCSDFSAARNASLSFAKGDWILVLDADERLEDPQSILPLLEVQNVDAYDIIMCNLQPKGSLTRVERSRLPRLFRNKGYRYEGMIHEQISPSLHAHDAQRMAADLVIVHHGYQTETVQGGDVRFTRNMELLQKQIAKHPEDFYYLYHLALMYKQKDPEQSETLFVEVLEKGGIEIPDSLRGQVYMRLAQLALEREDHMAVINCCKQSLRYDPQNVISKVCQITSLCGINAFNQASVLILEVIEHHLDDVGNPNDFVSLYAQLKELGFA
jgi:glycosyltransferase involved in cell wall biosynthesis